jgi:hypothetical protein
VDLPVRQADQGPRDGREQQDRWEILVQRETLDPVVPPDRLDPQDLLVDLDRGVILDLLESQDQLVLQE